MEIIVAKSAGFCFGVSRAIEFCYNEIGKDVLYTYGPLIHNKEVTSDLENKGVRIIDGFDDIDSGTIVIRSHGVGKSVYDEIEAKKLRYIDGTCPFVKKIHDIVNKGHIDGKKIIIIGDASHPEVIGINGWCENQAVIINDVSQVKDIHFDFGHYILVVQTTFRKSKFEEIKNQLLNAISDLEIFNTICSATDLRQAEAIELSEKVNKMIVIGDKMSSNTQKLYEICKKNCRNSYNIETFHDLVLNNFCKNDKIGITAGASTPSAIIKEVVRAMSGIDAIKNEEDGELSFQQLLDESFVTLHTGDIVRGTVIQISGEEVSVNLGYKSDGVIPRGEFSSDPSVVPSKEVQVGQDIDVFVVRVNDGEGNVLLSKKRIESIKGMEDVEKAYNDKTPVTGLVTEVVKGGIIAMVNGVRVFIPSSQVSNRFLDDLSVFKGQELTFDIIELDRVKRRIIGSRKAILTKEDSVKRAAVLETIEIGSKVKGTVSRLTDFGAFVDLGGIDGLIHISEMSWGRIKKTREVLSEGDVVEVVVLDVDKEKGKISLSLKNITENPWNSATQKYELGSVVEGKVVRMVPFGAFVEIEPGIDGLVHISQISEKHIAKPEDALTIGEVIKVKVIEINAEDKKISLSKKEVDAPVEAEAPAEAE